MKRVSYQRSKETKRKLLDAVIALARRQSYETITVQAICREAGVSVGSFYHQFGSKDELVLAACEKVDGLLTDEMAQSLDSLPPLEAIDALIRRYVAFIRDLGPMLGEYYRVLLEHPNRLFRDGTQRFGREFRALLERAISEGDLVTDQGAEALTEVGLRLLRGTFMDWLIRGCSFDLEAAYTRGFAAFLRYARG